MDLKQWVKDARKHANLSQEKLGESLGVTKGNVSAWENGHHRPSVHQVVRIAEITGFPPLLGQGLPDAPPMPGVSPAALTQLLEDLRVLPGIEVSALLDTIHQKAEYARAVLRRAQEVQAPEAADRSAPAPSKPARPTTTATTMAAANARPRSTLKVKIGDGNPRQGLLPLTTVEDPFTAEPAPREREWYDQLAKR